VRAAVWGRRLPCALVAAVIVGGAVRHGIAQSAPAPSLKAAFLYNFARFTEWPPDALPADARLVMCATDGAVFTALEQMTAGRSVGGHPLEVRQLTSDSPLVRACHVLYLHDLDAKRAAGLLAPLKEMPILTVGELDGFIALGGVVQFLTEGGQIRFAINVESSRHARLRLNPQLLSLAKTI
jgi:uncharacterized protein DUF4154